MVYIEVQDTKKTKQNKKKKKKKTEVWDKKMSYNLFCSIGTQFVFGQSKVTYQQKISKHKKPIT